MSDKNTYSGPMWRFTNGQYIGGPYVSPVQSTVGTLSIAFHSDTSATVSCPMTTVAIEHFFNFKPPSESLSGSYVLKACTVVYNNGVMLKTDDGSMTASGTMVATPFSMSQYLTVNGIEVGGVTNYSYEYIIDDYTGLFYLNSGGMSSLASFSLSSYDLTTMVYTDLYGGFTEWDMWTKVSDKTTMSKDEIQGDNGSTLGVGGLVGAAVNK